MLAAACRGLDDAGVRSAIKVYDWQRVELFGTLANLLDHERNLGHAAEIAESITQYSRNRVGRPIDVVG